MRRPCEMGVIQIDVTNICERRCSNCTRMLAHHPRRFVMTRDNWRIALGSLATFPGVVGMFGGNPCLHPQFTDLIADFVALRPDLHRRGLWTSDLRRHAALVADTIGYLNFNDHHSACYVRKVHPDGTVTIDAQPDYHGSSHCPPLAAIRDLITDHPTLWRRITACPVQNRWSACITEIGGTLYAYACEVTAAFEHVYGHRTGIPLLDHPDWWAYPFERFGDQITTWCPQCGMALSGQGDVLDYADLRHGQARANFTIPPRPDHEQTDDITETHLPLFQRPGCRRLYNLIDSRKEP